MTEEEAAKLTARIEELEAELRIQKGLVTELLKRLYGAKSDLLSSPLSPSRFFGVTR